MSGFWTCHECGAEMYGFENCQFCGAHKGGGEAMSKCKAYVSMPRHNGERFAKLMVGEFERMNAMLDNVGKSRWFELFGTPERAARTLARMDVDACNWCVNSSGNPEDCKSCPYEYDYYGCYLPEKFSMLEWLRGDA